MNDNSRTSSYEAAFLIALEYSKRNLKNYRKQNIIKNIYRTQAYDSIVCRYFCIGFVDFMLQGKSLLDHTSSCSPNDYEKNDKIMLKYFL